ncbi:MAG TPA: hypothetical protein VG370_12520 [Chloroflexota bacterium]|nr:hypothetical protein [Chloroflexota bacterium]
MTAVVLERPGAGAVVRAALARRGRAAEVVSTGRLLRVRSAVGRVVYLLERSIGAGRCDWIVYADGIGREAARQHVCPSLGAALARLTAELGEGAPAAIRCT